MPALLPQMNEGTVTRWLKRKGDFVQPGDVLLEIDTEWATMEVEAVDEGVIEEILVPDGTVVKVNEPLASVISVSQDVEAQFEHLRREDFGLRRPDLLSPEGRQELKTVIEEVLRVAAFDKQSSPIEHPGRATLKSRGNGRRVFIVHGHDDAARYAVAEFLRKADFEPVVLHERPNKGRTIISKFQEEAEDVGFAVVLITPDDQGGKLGDPMRPRARQNVIFELGFFLGALGPDRVAALVKGEVDRPSDFDGVVYIDMDQSGSWRTALGQELQEAGLQIDWNRLMR